MEATRNACHLHQRRFQCSLFIRSCVGRPAARLYIYAELGITYRLSEEKIG